MSESGSTKSDAFSTVVTVLIALISTVIALVASQAAVTSGNASEAQHDGVLAKINRERIDGGSWVQVARNKRAFNTYRFNRQLYDLMFDYIGQAEAQGRTGQGTRLRLEAAGQLEESNLAWEYIDSGYLQADADGNYTRFDEDLYLKDQRQNAAIYQDIDETDNFDESAAAKTSSLGLSLSLLVWFIALMFVTWAQISHSALRWVWLVAGVLVMLGIGGAYLASWLVGLAGAG
jgi:hypothetical protein